MLQGAGQEVRPGSSSHSKRLATAEGSTSPASALFKRSRSCTADIVSSGPAHAGSASGAAVNIPNSVKLEDPEDDVDIVDVAGRDSVGASDTALPGAHPRTPQTRACTLAHVYSFIRATRCK